jgi:hypothetical protein
MNKFAILIDRISENEYLFKLEPPMIPPYQHRKEKDIEFVFIEFNLKIERAYSYAVRANIWASDEEGNKKFLAASITGQDEMTIEQIIDLMPTGEMIDRGRYKPVLVKLKSSTREHFGDIVNNL